jgi:hypothetical protein
VYRRHGNVCSVANDVRRKDTSSHYGLRQCIGVIGDRQCRQPANYREPLLNFRRIADRGLVDNDLGDRAGPSSQTRYVDSPTIPVWSVGAPRQLRHDWDERPRN